MTTVTITSQGQITIPANIRRAWGINGSEKLQMNYDNESGRLVIEKPLSVDEVTERLRSISRKDTDPLIDTHEFYEIERTKDIIEYMEGRK